MTDYEQQIMHMRVTQAIADAKRWITVRFQKEGIHCYPAALTDPKLSDVSFLGHPHRHIFHFEVKLQVFHTDRDLEFIQVKRWLESLYTDAVLSLDYKSCEMIADDLFMQISNRWMNRAVVISVFEDGENGSTTEYHT